ncbi:TetR/AcrR family transcriptional regulator [Sphingobium sp. CAP-1]|uniref:TetR/AcrR family transcriptional regulator n=1 Tax=Sphingobium sp. CAP-1 TaxID=2676077 RepID=UPI0012BB3215|nr:TetR/AcrR family transcriptional regulator [Sphingobium sp. CAP-1]QGP81185.1 TetR family transcriptional regulator [Sphingobium sp. CAP-1]
MTTTTSPLRTTPPRAPRQQRSQASFERMIAAAEALLRERGNDDFTLQEVGKRGKVSIGSIYCRFDSKDDLIRAVQAQVLEQVNADQLKVLAEAEAKASNLRELVPLLVNGIANVLRRHADLMRPMMLRATTDPIVAAAGKKSYAAVADRVQNMMLAHRDEIKQPDPDRAVHSAYRVLYAAIARYLGFGSATGAAWEGDWEELTQDLGKMCAAFLLSSD